MWRRRGRDPGGATASYLCGQFLSDAVFDGDEPDDDDVDDFDGDGELEAAWAIAEPPPTSTPETARAVSVRVS